MILSKTVSLSQISQVSGELKWYLVHACNGKPKMSSQGGLKHVSTEPSQLANKRERRRGPTGRAAVLRRAPSDSDCSGETASLSADSAERAPRAPPPTARSGKSRSSRSFYSRRRGSEWEVLEGLKDGQRFEKRPEVFNGYLHKKRKWPLKGWHKRFFVIDGGILVYARSPTDVARGRLHGSVDVGLSVISAKQRRRRIDIDADEFIYHLRAKTPDVYRTWLTVLKAHRLYRQHLLTFGARESAPKIHAPLEDLPPTDTSSRDPVFVLSSTSFSSSTSDERGSETPKDSVIYLTLEGNKGMYSIQPKTRTPEVFSKSMTMENLDTGYKTMRRCFTTNWLYKDCYSWFDERMATEKYFHYPVLCSTEFSFASKDSAKPRFNEKRYLCAQHMKMQEDTGKSRSFYAVRKSKKCTNVKRYQIINMEPRLPAPESQCVVLKKYVRKRTDKEKKNARKDYNVNNYRVIIRKKQKNQQINTVSTSSFDSITKNIITSLFDVKDSEQHSDHIKASVNKAVKRLYKGSHLDQPVKQLFRSLLEFYLSNAGYSLPSVKETNTDIKPKVKPSQKKKSKDADMSTSIINTKTKGTQIQELLNQICDAKETLLNAIYKSETVQKNVSTRDKNLSGIYPVTNASKEIQIEDLLNKPPVYKSVSSYSKTSNASSCKNLLNARKYKHIYHNLSSKLLKESEAIVKHEVKTVNPLATIIKRKENQESELELETVIQNTVYTCQAVDHHRNCRDSTVSPKESNGSNQILNKGKVFLTSSNGNSNQTSLLSCKLHVGDNVERISKKSQSKHIQIFNGLSDTNSDVLQISHETKTNPTSEESKEFQEENYTKPTTDKSVNGTESSSSATDKSMRSNISQKLLKTISIAVNNIQSLSDKAKSNNVKPEMLSKQTSLDQMLLVISSVFSEVNKMCSSSQTKLSTDSNDSQKGPIFSVKEIDSLSTKANEESNGSMDYDIHDVLVELRKVFSQDKKKERPFKCEPYSFINKHVLPAMYPMVDTLPKIVIVDVKESKIHKNPIKQYQTPTNCFLMNDYPNIRQYSSFSRLNSTNDVKESDDLDQNNDMKFNKNVKTKRSTYTAKIKNVRRCIARPRVNFEISREEKPLPKYMDETFIQLLLENMDLILNNLPAAYKDLYAKLSQTSDYSVEIDLLRKMYKKVIASTDKEAQFDTKIQLLKDTIDVFTEVSNNLLKRQVEDKNLSANASTVNVTVQTSRKPHQKTNENLDLEKIFCDQNLSANVLTFDGMGQTSRKLSQVYNNLDLQKVYSSKTEQTSSSILYSNLNLMNQFSEKKSLIRSSLHQEFLKLRSSIHYKKRKNEKTFINVQNVKVEKDTFKISDPAQLNSDISTVGTLNKFSSTMLSPKSFPERYMKASRTASGIVIDTNEEIIRIEEIQKVTDYEELPKAYLVVIASNRRNRTKKSKNTSSIKQLLLRTPPPTPVKISTEIQTSKSIRNRKLKRYSTFFRNASTSDNEPPGVEKSSDINTIYRCTSESSYFSGLISPTSPPIRGPQAGFVSGTPGGRLASWIIESGGPLENASKELGQAQLSVQQLQRLLDALELQQQVHHDTDVSLEGASPNVKKDRRKFGLRKKKSNSKCASVELAPPLHIDPSSSHMALSTLTAPPSPGGGASSAPNSAASLPIACAAARPQSLPGPDSICGAGGPASLTSLTPDHQLREDFTVLAKDLVASLKSIVGTLVCERGRLRAAMDAGDASTTPGGAMVAALRTNLSSALQQNSELRNRLSRIHDASDLAEISSMGHNSDPIARQFQASLSYSSSCVSASEFFDAEEHEEDDAKQEMIAADETGVIELDGDSSSEVGSLSSEEGSASSDNSDGALLSAEQVTLRLNENGLEPAALKSAGWTRRKRLPCPRPTPGGPSLWNLLYKNIGKDLSQISMPVTINEPLNMLQRLCEELEYSELLDAAAECRSPIERMALIAAFAVSAYAAAAHRAASKPFNPLLGETYECVRDDKGFRFIAEQVSHHPPISACHAESPRWCLWQEARIKTKFWGKSMEFQPAGRVHVRLLSTGDHYSWNKVTTCVHNLFGGQRWVDQYGDMHITCHGTDISCKLNFIKASSWSTTRHEVRGAVTQPSTGARLRLQGRWSEALHAGEPPAARCLWRPGAMPPEHELYYGFTRFAMELNELEPGMRDLLPHTDTRLRPDQRALEEGDVDAAEQYKHQLEQSQRERRRDSPEHHPRWFRQSQEGGEEMWVFGNEYWKAREAGFLNNAAPNIW